MTFYVIAVFCFKQFFNKKVISRFMSMIKSQQPVLGFFLGRGTLPWFSKICCSNSSELQNNEEQKATTRNRASYATLAPLCSFCSLTRGFSFQHLTTWSLFSSDHSGFEVYIPTAHLQGLFLPVENFIYVFNCSNTFNCSFPLEQSSKTNHTRKKQCEVTSYQASRGKNGNNCLTGSRECRK